MAKDEGGFDPSTKMLLALVAIVAIAIVAIVAIYSSTPRTSLGADSENLVGEAYTTVPTGCYDSDGKDNWYAWGQVIVSKFETYPDYCEGDKVYDAYCSSGVPNQAVARAISPPSERTASLPASAAGLYPAYSSYNCPYGCTSGVCNPEPDPCGDGVCDTSAGESHWTCIEDCEITCTDHDNGQNFFVASYAEGRDAYGYEFELYDTCTDPEGTKKRLREYYCEPDPKLPGLLRLMNVPHYCEAKCENGKCIPDNYPPSVIAYHWDAGSTIQATCNATDDVGVNNLTIRLYGPLLYPPGDWGLIKQYSRPCFGETTCTAQTWDKYPNGNYTTECEAYDLAGKYAFDSYSSYLS